MATITPQFGYELVAQIEDGGTYKMEACINTSRGVKYTVNTDSDELPDINDQSKPAQLVRRTRSVDVTIDGAGMIHADDVGKWWKRMETAQPLNMKFTDGVNTLTGAFLLTSFTHQGDRTKTAECQMTFESAGPWSVETA